jgi:hypothetical protein
MKSNTIVKFSPPNPDQYTNHPLTVGENVLYLGEITNAPGHCAVATSKGKVVWMVHPDEFIELTEEEL